jgi:YVTN family beta-propeller protein
VGAALVAVSVLFVTGGAQAGGPGGFADDKPQSWVTGGQEVTAIVGSPLDGSNMIYLADKAGIERRDLNTWPQVGTPVSTETGFSGLALSPDGDLLYATQPVSHRVAVFDTATNTVVRRMDQFGTATRPTAIAVSPDGSRLYTASSEYSSISVLDAKTGNVQRTIAAPAGMSPASAISLTEDGRQLYVADSAQGTVWSIDTTTFATDVTVTGLGGPVKGFAVSPDGVTGYAALGGDTPALKTIDIAKGVIIYSTALSEAPSATAVLWVNQVFVALPTHTYLDTYYAPFTPQPANSDRGTVMHGVVGWTDAVQAKPMPGFTITYQWWAGHYSPSTNTWDGTPIPGATSREFLLTEAQLGYEMRAYIYAHAPGMAPNMTHVTFGSPVLAPMRPRTPVISGRAAVGNTVRAKSGSWGPHTKVRFSYQWYAGKKPIRGATHTTLKIGKSTAGQKLRVRVTGRQDVAKKSALSRFTKKVKH